MINVSGLWADHPILKAILCVGGIICLIFSIIEERNNNNNENTEV